jgi:hypothetical protein
MIRTNQKMTDKIKNQAETLAKETRTAAVTITKAVNQAEAIAKAVNQAEAIAKAVNQAEVIAKEVKNQAETDKKL